jgi:hypothetical protein
MQGAHAEFLQLEEFALLRRTIVAIPHEIFRNFPFINQTEEFLPRAPSVTQLLA